jgi:protein subunit release factor A
MSDDTIEDVPSLDRLEKVVEVTTYQASGPGGQHRNRTYSAVRMTHPPTGITVTASDTRSQLKNRKIALKRLHERLVEHFKTEPPRVATRKSKAVRERERSERIRRAQRKQMRQSPDSDYD